MSAKFHPFRFTGPRPAQPILPGFLRELDSPALSHHHVLQPGGNARNQANHIHGKEHQQPDWRDSPSHILEYNMWREVLDHENAEAGRGIDEAHHHESRHQPPESDQIERLDASMQR